MRLLLLMRHAKAVADDPGGDHARGLSATGRADALRAGQVMARRAAPDFAVASDARRTRETLLAVCDGLGRALPYRLDAKLYAAAPDSILSVVGAVDADVRCLLVIGHNPGIGDLARRLATAGERAAREKLANRFATATFAVLGFDAETWAEIGEGGRLDALVTRD